MNGIPYKGTFVAKGSALHAALTEGNAQKATKRMKELVKPQSGNS